MSLSLRIKSCSRFRLMQKDVNTGDSYAVAVMDFDFSSLVRL